MDARRSIAPLAQAEPEIALSIESLDAEMPPMECDSHGEDTPVIAISIVTNSRLLSEGLLPLLSPHLNLQLIGTYSGEFRVSSPLPNPQGYVMLLDSSNDVRNNKYIRAINDRC